MCVCAAQYKKKCKKQRCVLEVDVDDAAFCPAHAPKSLDLGGLLIVGSEGHARAPEDAPAGIRLHRDDRDVNEGANPVRDDVHDRALEKGEAGSDPVEARDLVAVKEVRRERSVEVALGRKGHVAAEHLGGEGREVLPGDENKEARALEGDEVALVVRAAPLRVVLRAALRARTRVARQARCSSSGTARPPACRPSCPWGSRQKGQQSGSGWKGRQSESTKFGSGWERVEAGVAAEGVRVGEDQSGLVSKAKYSRLVAKNRDELLRGAADDKGTVNDDAPTLRQFEGGGTLVSSRWRKLLEDLRQRRRK